MHDVALVDGINGPAEVDAHLQGPHDGQRLASIEELLQAAAVDVLEDEVQVTAGARLQRVGGDDVGVREAAGDLRFLAKARLIVLSLLGREKARVVQQLLDSDWPVHARVVTEVDLAKGSLADDGGDPVLAREQRTGAEHERSFPMGSPQAPRSPGSPCVAAI